MKKIEASNLQYDEKMFLMDAARRHNVFNYEKIADYYSHASKEMQELMLILNTHAKLQKDVTYDKSQKHEDVMDRLDYLYGADRMMSFRNFDIHLLSYEEMKAAMAAQGFTDEEMFVVSFKPRITKTGKKMASLTLADTSRDLHSITVFPTSFAKAYMHIEEGNAYKFKFGKTKDGTVTMNEVESV